MNVMRLLMGLALLVAASAAVGAEPCVPTIEDAWVRAAPPGTTTLAGYLVVRNDCDVAVAVTGVESADFAMPMIHRSVVEDGVAKMRPAGDLTVPAGGELRFAPGGLHLMLMQPKRPLAEGDAARIALVLADGRRLAADFPVLKNRAEGR